MSFLSENFQFLEVKFSIYLNRRVFLMEDGNAHHRAVCIQLAAFKIAFYQFVFLIY